MGLVPAACAPVPAPESATANSSGPSHYVPITSIDFSPKHDVMIRNDDGTLTPMDVPYYRSKKIAPGVWQVESDGDYSYLVEGSNQALAIDTGYGAGNIRAYLQTLTSKPVRFVANTHYHFDHTANDAYFDMAYMSKETAEKATIPYPSFAGINFPRDYPRQIVKDGDTIDLGDRKITVLIIPNHTPGGTAYLDPKSRIVFSGDEIMGRNEPLNIPVAQFAANMRKLEAHRSEFDTLAGGPGIFEAATVDKYLAAANAVLGGALGTQPTPWSPPHQASAGDSSGTVIYDRRRVRAPDRPPGMGQANPNQRVMKEQDVQITYDMQHIQN